MIIFIRITDRVTNTNYCYAIPRALKCGNLSRRYSLSYRSRSDCNLYDLHSYLFFFIVCNLCSIDRAAIVHTTKRHVCPITASRRMDKDAGSSRRIVSCLAPSFRYFSKVSYEYRNEVERERKREELRRIDSCEITRNVYATESWSMELIVQKIE